MDLRGPGGSWERRPLDAKARADGNEWLLRPAFFVWRAIGGRPIQTVRDAQARQEREFLGQVVGHGMAPFWWLSGTVAPTDTEHGFPAQLKGICSQPSP